MQSANRVFLVRPANFGFNAETAGSNAFQSRLPGANLNEKALLEFDLFAEKLVRAGIDVTVFEDSAVPVKPDAIFPNNWLSTHPDGRLILYPMCAANRRVERTAGILNSLKERFFVKEVIDLTAHENEGRFLEGTGSVVFDHLNKIAYGCLSPRTDRALLFELAALLGYTPHVFCAHDHSGKEIYHTNVMMCVGEKFALVCAESVSDVKERHDLLHSLGKGGRGVIEISREQMSGFAGNMLELRKNDGTGLVVLSGKAYSCLSAQQINVLEKQVELLPLAIPTIETVGGGSARCMIAELFLPPL